jgi:4-diphosphocytidyl-2-C-methyl-D-erythritol kinase
VSSSETVVRLLAPAKLTLWLRVLGVRADGYHELDSEMVSVDLADELFIDPRGDGLEIELDGVAATVSSGPTNLIRRALDAVGKRAGVRLVKRIPVGGGLGGGSSDAAAVLRWAGCGDLELAARLGADVPFCVRGGRARVGGLGDRVVPLEDEPRSFVLLVPPLEVETAAVYRAWDRLAEGRQRATGEGSQNDLSAAALEVVPQLARWRDWLGERTGLAPRLAGSGATWFVEGSTSELGLDATRRVELDGGEGRLIPVRAVGPEYSAGPRAD